MQMMSCRFFAVISIAVFLSVAAAGDSSNDIPNECVYTLYVQTGSGIKSGTDSTISMTLGDSSGRSVWIPNLELWGLMGHNHDYFEMGYLDIFSGRGPCIGGPLCHLNLTSDGSGAHHGWFCEYIEVTSTGPHKECSQTIFYVDRWLATDAPPFDLTVVLDGCLKDDGPRKHGETGAFVVGKQQQQQQPIGSASE
ncbi:PLAT domain-containing protein 1 [Camellia lanceoleosa]|uniref:PLAT domain-containing protein 1 n=1 Tax=Camellia lanceoleosa TaxID=1840588 RepID=A0ACC0H0X0_9ERIC|nr:PLAT domain-containing protein 1 [Camellia lanceoleosa]